MCLRVGLKRMQVFPVIFSPGNMDLSPPDMMAIPEGARAAARVLVLSEHRRLLLLKAQASGHEWWLAPGGGLENGETFEDGAKRELYEETGMSLSIGPWVWTRLHQYTWEGRVFAQYERFFVARAAEGRLVPGQSDGYVVGYRWWTPDEIQRSSEQFAPRRLGELLPGIMRGEYPNPALDCGV